MEELSKQEWRLLAKYYKEPHRFKDPGGKFQRLIKYIEENFSEGRDFSEKSAMYRNGVRSVPRCSCGEMVKFSKGSYTWQKTCGKKCYTTNFEPSNTESVIVDGVVYTKMKEAKEVEKNLIRRLYDCTDDGVLFVDNHEQRCRDKLSKNHPDLIKKEVLEELRNNRVIIADIAKKFGVSRDVVNNAFLFHGITKKWDQLEAEVYQFLNDKERFEKEFVSKGSEILAEEYGCSPSTILQTAASYGIKAKRVRSGIEIHFEEWLKGLGVNVVTSDRTLIGKELDLLLPDHNIAIEFDGLFWHCEWDNNTKQRDVHLEKVNLCSEKGVLLLRFTDDETTNKRDVVKSIILSKIGYSTIKHHARKCNVTEIDSTTARRFFELNHIAGYAPAEHYLALEFEGEIVFCCSFGVPRFGKLYDWEIVRMASTLMTTVVGGFSRCLTYFRKRHPGTIMTYADRRFGNGNVYKTNGFEFVKNTSPGYFYYKKGEIVSRYKFQKHRLKELLDVFDPNLTEEQNVFANGYGRYWDCGNSVWVLY